MQGGAACQVASGLEVSFCYQVEWRRLNRPVIRFPSEGHPLHGNPQHAAHQGQAPLAEEVHAKSQCTAGDGEEAVELRIYSQSAYGLRLPGLGQEGR